MASSPLNGTGSLLTPHLHASVHSQQPTFSFLKPPRNYEKSAAVFTFAYNPYHVITVFKQPLKLFSKEPMTGYYRDGWCRTGGIDGNHAVAGIVTDEFLDFSASRGNDLRSVGLKGGCRWCLCTARWLEAVNAYRSGKVTSMGVPRVDLDATEDSALNMVDMDTFRQFAVRNAQSSANSNGN